MKTIYYVRHGESQANVDGLTAGAELDSPLTNNGRQQAKKAGQELKGKGIALIVCSPLERTRETARIIAKEIGYNPAKIVEKQEFIERYVGVYSAVPYSKYRDDIDKNALHESAESTAAMYKRVKKGLDWLKRQKAHTILVVSHGGTSRMLRIVLQNLEHENLYQVEAFGNAEIFEFTLE